MVHGSWGRIPFAVGSFGPSSRDCQIRDSPTDMSELEVRGDDEAGKAVDVGSCPGLFIVEQGTGYFIIHLVELKGVVDALPYV